MNKKIAKKYYLIGGILIIMILGLGIFSLIMYMKYERLEDKYDDMDYEYFDHSLNNNDYPSINDDINSNNKYISQEEALNIVLNNLNISRNDIYDLDIELEYKARYGDVVYEVSFDLGQYEYEYYLKATTGAILDSLRSRD